ncbi:MAG TPA: roadblock/LC7 domain-containing protein [Longimicrobiales bacterium]
MSDSFERTLEGLTRVAGVRAALVVDADAGVPVAAEVAADVAAPALAALSASAFRRSRRAAESASFGAVETLQLEAESGHVIVAAAADVLVVVVAEPDAQLGRIRLEARRTADGLR